MFKLPTEYEVLVVGSGHAGIEAALAAARIGCRTLMLTQNLDTIGQMSCNPAIGGLAKGHIVREIDAMGGAMGLNADATGIQFRMLNRTKGPSVRSPRVQCDKKAYQFRMKAVLERASNLDLKQATVSKIIVEDGRVAGVETDIGVQVLARALVITSAAGTDLWRTWTSKSRSACVSWYGRDASSSYWRTWTGLRSPLPAGTTPRVAAWPTQARL